MTDSFYLSTYRKSYVRQPIKPIVQVRTRQEFPDPIAVAQKPYLFLRKKDLRAPEEDGEEYFEKFKKENVDAKKFPYKDLESELIIKRIKEGRSSEYRVKYCDDEVERVLYQKRKEFRLPDDAIIPLTTQRGSFKNPLDYTPRALDRVVVSKPKGGFSVVDKKKLEEILQVRTGLSEYMEAIGTFGELILKERKEKSLRRGRE